jgi:hypothetical protein
VSPPQLEALRLLADGNGHHTAKSTRGVHIGGGTALALERRGWAKATGFTFTITDAGRAALAAEEAGRVAELAGALSRAKC